GGIGFKPDLILLIGITPIFFIEKLTGNLKIVKTYKLLAFLLLILMLISNNAGLFYYQNSTYSFSFPTEFIQIYSRVGSFLLFLYLGYSQIIKHSFFVNYVSVIL